MLKHEALNTIWAALDQFTAFYELLTGQQKVCQVGNCETVLDDETTSPDPEICRECHKKIFEEPEEARPAVNLMEVWGPFGELEERRRGLGS